MGRFFFGTVAWEGRVTGVKIYKNILQFLEIEERQKWRSQGYLYYLNLVFTQKKSGPFI